MINYRDAVEIVLPIEYSPEDQPDRRRRAEPNYSITIFDLLDNFFGDQQLPNTRVLPGPKIIDLREHILALYDDYQAPPISDAKIRSFPGGYVASSPFLVEHAHYLFSSLLYFDSTVLSDPLYRWFSRPVTHADRPRFLDERGYPQIGLTKDYLEEILPWLYHIRPLVEAEIIHLAPLDGIISRGYVSMVKPLSGAIREHFDDLAKLSNDFSPSEITVHDTQTGLFVFAGGNANEQITQAFELGLDYYARQLYLGAQTGSTFVAPSRWDRFLCERTLNHWLAAASQIAVVEALSRLRIPLIETITPDVVLKLHRDSAFPEFRAELSSMFSPLREHIGKPEFGSILAEYERDVLLPKLQRIQHDLSEGTVARAIRNSPTALFYLSQTIATGLSVGIAEPSQLFPPAVVMALSEWIRSIFEKSYPSGVSRLWASLLPPSGDLSSYIGTSSIPEVKGRHSQKHNEWNIAEKPSMNVTVSPGLYYQLPPFKRTVSDEALKSTKRNDKCPCGSGLRFKICCGFGVH